MSEVAEKTFVKELRKLINRHSRENKSNTPDFLLAEYLEDCLENFDRIVKLRSEWHGTWEEDYNIQEEESEKL